MYAATEKGREHPLPETEAVARTIDAERSAARDLRRQDVGRSRDEVGRPGQPSRRLRLGGRPNAW